MRQASFLIVYAPETVGNFGADGVACSVHRIAALILHPTREFRHRHLAAGRAHGRIERLGRIFAGGAPDIQPAEVIHCNALRMGHTRHHIEFAEGIHLLLAIPRHTSFKSLAYRYSFLYT